jgi:hypothetical protein
MGSRQIGGDAVLVARWPVGLICLTSQVLLDQQAPERFRDAIRLAIEADGATAVTDLHVGVIGPGKYAAIIGVVTETLQSADELKAKLPGGLQLAHVTVEPNRAAVISTREGAPMGCLTSAVAGIAVEDASPTRYTEGSVH